MSTNLDQYYNYYYKKFCPPRIAMKLWGKPYLLGGGGGGGGAPLDGGGGGGVALTPLGFPEDFEPPENKEDTRFNQTTNLLLAPNNTQGLEEFVEQLIFWSWGNDWKTAVSIK